MASAYSTILKNGANNKQFRTVRNRSTLMEKPEAMEVKPRILESRIS